MDLLERAHGRDGAIAGLLHDAHEAYTGDVGTPIKSVLGPVWRAFERAWEHRVRTHYRMPDLGDALRTADLVALATEREQLMPACDSWDVPLPEHDWGWVCYGWDPPIVASSWLWHAARLGLV